MLDVVEQPFRHVIVDGWWPEDLLRDVVIEFPEPEDPRWRRFASARESKSEGGPALWGDRTREYFDLLAAHTDEISEAFGIPDLHMETVGGGYHLIDPGGYLAVHTDFSVSPLTGRFRRLNILTYLNDDWADPGGRLQLWADRRTMFADIAPEFNRTVIFETSDHSWHGHPISATRPRRSLAAYMFTDARPVDFANQSTVFLKIESAEAVSDA